MAVLTAGDYGLQSDLGAGSWLGYIFLDALPNYLKFYNNSLNFTILNGSNLTYSQTGGVLTGTITSIQQRVGGAVAYNLTGISGNAPTIQSYVLSGNPYELMNYLFSGSDVIMGSGSLDQFDGRGGNDSLYGGFGDDYLGGGAGNDYVSGGGDDDNLTGGSGNDTIDGGAGDDTMVGGAGNDTYFVDSVNDVIQDFDDASGVDLVNSSVNWTLFYSEENLNLTGGGAIDGTGSALNNVINGNGNANHIAGDAGADTLKGGAGNDTINGDAGNDRIFGGVDDDVLDGGADTDIVSYADATSGVTVSLGLLTAQNTGGAGLDTISNFEILEGSAFGDSLAGSSAADTLYGLAGGDTLSGAAGADTLIGGLGDDVYVVDAADVVTEAPGVGSGVDTIQAALTTYSLAAIANVENLTYTGGVSFTGTGNALANVITGAAGADTLDGGAGADTLDGGAGSDLLLGGIGDVLIGGADADTASFLFSNAQTINLDLRGLTVIAGRYQGVAPSVSMSGVENVTVAFSGAPGVGSLIFHGAALAENIAGSSAGDGIYGGRGADFLSGMNGADSLWGQDGNDTLDGGAGVDTMVGGAGGDVYIVDDARDFVVEAQEMHGAGAQSLALRYGVLSPIYTAFADLVKASASYTLSDNVENLTLMGSGNIAGTGNALNNVLTGNAGDNVLNGKGGADFLSGGLGQDAFVFDAVIIAGQSARILDFNVADDALWLDNVVFTALGAPGALTNGQFRIGAAAADANDHLVYNSMTGALYYDSDGNGAGGAVQIATLSAHLALTSADFAII